MSTTASVKPPLPGSLIFALAAAAGLAVANIYYSQPMLGLMQAELGAGSVGFVPMATQLGYALGLFFLVPFGDIAERKRLILSQFALLVAALAAAALAPSGMLLLLASLLIGVGATAAQQIVPLAAHFAPDHRRGAIIGMVMSGLLCGILLSRTLAGFVAAHAGWRTMFLLAIPLALAAMAWLGLALPQSRGSQRLSYPGLLASLYRLWRELPQLRVAAITQALIFGAFSVFWTILALYLQQPRFGLGSEAAGLFGVLGVVGVLAAPIAGRLADKRGPCLVVVLGSLLALFSWAIFGLWPSLPGLMLGVILLDFAMQAVLISNQHIVYALNPDARARLNTLFMTSMFLGGAAGSMGSMIVWLQGGWPAICMLGGLFCLLAVALQIRQWLRVET